MPHKTSKLSTDRAPCPFCARVWDAGAPAKRVGEIEINGREDSRTIFMSGFSHISETRGREKQTVSGVRTDIINWRTASGAFFINSGSRLLGCDGNYLFDSRNDPKLMHKTYWKVHLNSEEVFLRDIAAVLSPAMSIKYLIKSTWPMLLIVRVLLAISPPARVVHEQRPAGLVRMLARVCLCNKVFGSTSIFASALAETLLIYGHKLAF
jgi:hypothetical protein